MMRAHERSVPSPLFVGVVWLVKPFSERQLSLALRACTLVSEGKRRITMDPERRTRVEGSAKRRWLFHLQWRALVASP